MGILKWYSGGNDRAKKATYIIDQLLLDLKNNPQSESLQQVLRSYREALIQKQAAVPLILSRMNLEISNVLIRDRITLTKLQSDKIGQLSSLSNIRYGY
ncbi:bacteriocin immunity protein [Lacticaseibacillus parahuelsenbergensis]|uniref:Bacteriocin immunity protein n=1 Tax=Lacticaseibacillus parahuelsenbergensis TaxID=3068305 RepID=A0ABY9L3R7_9LACO|nr:MULTISPECIES: bacteriocin immunity protein [Lacticaseibacillus]MDE3281146.1 bacteriocin immunity protein [Lacticaseibacillus casei]WLV78075.1 bacteriocin immunity protein [Lacticaseibacillus sp. NCIMB 15471]